MTPELWQRLKPLYNNAIELQEPRRAQFIAEACGTDAELREALESLLGAADRSTEPGQCFLNIKDVLRPADKSFFDNEIILGRFQIIRHLGTGGMGEVYEAKDLELGRIALKTIRLQIASSPRAFERFRQEVVLARKVSGPEVCRIHELFLLPATTSRPATAFLTMEYLAGIPLSEKLLKDGTLPLKETLRIALDICEGLQLIHQQGIVHRDLKPSNIMLCERNGLSHAVLMDFGLALAAPLDCSDPKDETSSALSARTITGSVAGTPAYMAPEQFEGKPLTPATDIFALGVVLYQLFTCRHPYPVNTPAGVAMRRLKRPWLPSTIRSELPRHWDRVIERCLEDEPSERFQTAEQVAKALKASPYSLENLRKDRPWVLRVAGALALAVIGWGLLHWWQSRQYYHPAAEELHWYEAGVASLREGSYLKATKELERAAQKNNRFAMAHARLAEAWSDLDLDGTAQREMLIATAQERHLQPLDRMYLDAIRATLTHDYDGAVVLYRRILDRLPDSERAAGHVDLGMAYERAGDPKLALQNYEEGSRLDKDNAAAYLHAAVLESRSNDFPQADQAFSHAESIMTAEMDQEGLANLDYERGYAANVSGHLDQAEQFQQRSLKEAEVIPNTQLEIRALIQLSSVAARQNPEKAVEFAQQAIHLARDNQLDFWTSMGESRLAAARIMQGSEHDQQAEEAAQEALRIATLSQHPRAEALANVMLASVFDQENRTDDVIAPAQAALAYYKQNSYFEPAARASLLLVRAELKLGDYSRATLAANNLLTLARQSGIRNLEVQAEETVGDSSREMEHYPDALVRYQRAWALDDLAEDKAYQALNCADVLWRLGRYKEANIMLAEAKQTLPDRDRYLSVQIASLLSQQKYQQAAELTENAIAHGSKPSASMLQRYETYLALAEAHLGKKGRALSNLYEILRGGEEINDRREEAATQLAEAEVYLFVGNAEEAKRLAGTAAMYYASVGRYDSELRSACLAALASKLEHDEASYKSNSNLAFNTLSSLKSRWDSDTFSHYLSRPDLQMLMRELPLKQAS